MDAHELMLRRSQQICVVALVNARFSILKKQKPNKLNLSPGVALYVPNFNIRTGTVLKYGKLFYNIHICCISLLCLLGKRFEIEIAMFSAMFICDRGTGAQQLMSKIHCRRTPTSPTVFICRE